MKSRNLWGVLAAVALVAGSTAWAEGERLLHLENTLSLGYDDNVSYSMANEVDSFVFTDTLVLTADRPTESGFVGLRAGGGYTWYEEDDVDDHWSASGDVVFNHSFARRVSLNLRDAFLYQERPEVVRGDGVVNTPETAYTYNTLEGTVSTLVGAKARVDVNGRWQMLRYDGNRYQAIEDYDIYSLGAMVGRQIGKDSVLGVDLRYDDVNYDNEGDAVVEDGQVVTAAAPGTEGGVPVVPDRGYEAFSVGLSFDKIFSPNLLGKIRAGYMMTDYNAANNDGDDTPYVDAQVTVLPSPQTRLTLGGSYSLYQSGITTFSAQERASGTLSLGHDITSRLTLILSGMYINSSYSADSSVDLVEEAAVADGDESTWVGSARLSYRVNRNNWIEGGLYFVSMESDFSYRPDEYDRTRYDVAWKIRL